MIDRDEVLSKTDGHCAYCGSKLKKGWHIDHVEPLYRGYDKYPKNNDIDNLMPACPRCNIWKHTHSVEKFRQEIEAQPARLYRNSPGYRLANDYGIVISGRSVVFYFEKMERKASLQQMQEADSW